MIEKLSIKLPIRKTRQHDMVSMVKFDSLFLLDLLGKLTLPKFEPAFEVESATLYVKKNSKKFRTIKVKNENKITNL